MVDDGTIGDGDSLAIVDGTVRPVGSQCDRCGEVTFPVRMYCPSCMTQMDTHILETDAELETYSIHHVSSPGFRTPYPAGFVQFPDEGIRAFTPLVGDNDAFTIGMALEPTVTEVGESTETWAFRPAQGGSDA